MKNKEKKILIFTSFLSCSLSLFQFLPLSHSLTLSLPPSSLTLSLSLSSFRQRPRPAFTRTQYVSDCTNVLCTFCVYDYLFHRWPTIIMPVPASASMPSRQWCYNEREKRVTTPRRAHTVGLRRFICSGGRLLFHYYLYLYFFFIIILYTHTHTSRSHAVHTSSIAEKKTS